VTDFLSFGDRLSAIRDRWRAERSDSKPRWFRRRWIVPALLVSSIAAVLVFDAWLYTCGFAGCPSSSEIRAFRPPEGGKILDRDGKLIGRLAIIRRVNVPLASVPKHVQEAFIATEDRRFYEHDGLDWRAFARAVVRNVSSLGVREGFSTITMQVARNSFLQNRYHGRSLRRKLVELRLTRLIESELTKAQILEHYLNVIYLGNGENGVEAASRDLFGKHVNELTVAEGAMLAALPKGPSAYTPRRDRERALRRRNLVLGLMVQEGYITTTEAAAAQRAPLRVAKTEWRPSARDEPGALDAVRAFVDSVLPDVLQQEGEVIVHTTIDATLQKAADRAVARHAAAVARESRSRNGETVQGAYLAMEPASGDIRALVGGRRSDVRGGFDRALNARRQPGSAFKPFVYAAALAAGYSPASMVDDEPVQVMTGRTVWTPANYGDEYAGRVTLRRALELSANAATVRVSRAVGEQQVIAAARRNGIRSELDPVPAIALGAMEVTPVELVAAYAPFANGGRRVKPRLVRRIEAPDGTVLWSQEIETTPAMDPRDAYEITSMLRAVVNYGTGRALRQERRGRPTAAPTCGSSASHRRSSRVYGSATTLRARSARTRPVVVWPRPRGRRPISTAGASGAAATSCRRREWSNRSSIPRPGSSPPNGVPSAPASGSSPTTLRWSTAISTMPPRWWRAMSGGLTTSGRSSRGWGRS
jgi:membrane peptidoglycan carboxypeptidase